MTLQTRRSSTLTMYQHVAEGDDAGEIGDAGGGRRPVSKTRPATTRASYSSLAAASAVMCWPTVFACPFELIWFLKGGRAHQIHIASEQVFQLAHVATYAQRASLVGSEGSCRPRRRHTTPCERSFCTSSAVTPHSASSTSAVCSPSSGGRVTSAGESDSFTGQPTVW